MKNLINRWVVLGALGVAAFLLFFSLLIGYGFTRE